MSGNRYYISVIGASCSDQGTARLAGETGRLIGAAGAVLVCGGMGGVMEAACRGAKSAGGTTIGILPGLDSSGANAWLDLRILTGIGHARNLAIAASGDVVIAIGGGSGTLSEIGLSLKCGRTVIMLGGWEISRNGETPAGIIPASTPAEAVRLAVRHCPDGGS